ncbi:hypothetical protein BDV26DRAFT_68644 [Aspergillus bertholletiae]|uniref:Uncharacterized protein n=1 Tax=Aspergillus bertholletiae TaxID=1226010 RepID=A0A5N7AUC6_9EURO|nr:hypothetical protein BDV26DRAFT_68644 [Aspergillus bertholletiae]
MKEPGGPNRAVKLGLIELMFRLVGVDEFQEREREREGTSPREGEPLQLDGWSVKVRTAHLPSHLFLPTVWITNNRRNYGVSTLPDHRIPENI